MTSFANIRGIAVEAGVAIQPELGEMETPIGNRDTRRPETIRGRRGMLPGGGAVRSLSRACRCHAGRSDLHRHKPIRPEPSRPLQAVFEYKR